VAGEVADFVAADVVASSEPRPLPRSSAETDELAALLDEDTVA
jgi:hypothetical protein